MILTHGDLEERRLDSMKIEKNIDVLNLSSIRCLKKWKVEYALFMVMLFFEGQV